MRSATFTALLALSATAIRVQQPPCQEFSKCLVPMKLTLSLLAVGQVTGTSRSGQLDGYITALDNIASKYSTA